MCLLDIRVPLAVASRLTLLGLPAGKNAHFRLRQQARALGATALRLRELPGATMDRTHARSVRAAFAPCAPHACEPQARVSLV